MTLWVTLAIGFAAGIHGAMYGAYKDSPHESFRPWRCVREVAIATGLAGLAALLHVSDGQSPFIIYLATFALVRLVTEFWKLFLRDVPQNGFRIPTQIHCVTGVIQHRGVRLLISAAFIGAIIGIWALCTLVPLQPVLLRGLIVGFIVGLAEAIGGAYKDGAVEGFYWHKFAKSPVFGALGGLIVAGHTDHLPFMMLATFGTYRMILELLFKMVVPGYAPGKFFSITGSYTDWTSSRWCFLPPYVATWALYLVLATHPGW